MAQSIKMVQAGMMDSEELVIELSDGNTVELNVEQILSLHPHSIGIAKAPSLVKTGPRAKLQSPL